MLYLPSSNEEVIEMLRSTHSQWKMMQVDFVRTIGRALGIARQPA